MFQYTGDEVVTQAGQTATARVVTAFEQVALVLQVEQGDVEVRAAAGPVGIRLGHEAGKGAMTPCNLVCHQSEKHHAVGDGAGVKVLEVDLELTDAIFMVERIHAPTELVHGVHEFPQPGQVLDQPRHVVGWLGQVVALVEGLVAATGLILQYIELGLDAGIDAITHRRCVGQYPAQDVAAAGLEGFTFAPQVAGEPGGIGPPGQDGARCRIGVGRDLFVAHILWNTVHRRTSTQL